MAYRPLISVVIPTYNASAMLIESVTSALAQTYSRMEIIVVDDGSTDDTQTKVAGFVKRGQIRYVYQKNSKQAAARNAGIDASSGELIAFLDHDDVWEPKKLELQVPLFENSRVGLVYCGAKEVDLDGNRLWEKGSQSFCRGRIFDRLLFNHFITNSSVVVRRSCLEQSGRFREDLFGVDDIHLWLRICYYFEADYVPETMVSCRNHDRNMKKDQDSIDEKRFIALLDIFRRFELNATSKKTWLKLNADYQFSLGYRARKIQPRHALACYIRSMYFEPRWIQAAAIAKLFVPRICSRPK